MGGHISVGVRRADGTFQTIGVWTNPLRYYVQDEAFMNGSLAPLDDFFSRYLKDDVEEGFGPQATIPGEYGYVLVDEITHTVTDWQYYTDLGAVSDMSLSLEDHDEQDEETVAYRNLVMKYAHSARIVNRKLNAVSVEPLPVFTSDEDFVAHAKLLRNRDAEVKTVLHGNRAATYHQYVALNYVQFLLNFPAWTLIRHDSGTVEGFDAMKAAVAACVTLTPEEEEAWNVARAELTPDQLL